MRIKVQKLHPDAVVPAYATPGASGFDLVAIDEYEIEPGKTILVRTGLAFEVPEGFELQIRPRSGLSLNSSFRVANSPGTLDADFRGECCIIAQNAASEGTITVKKGARIAQGVICPVVRAVFEETDRLSPTERDKGGFGSTGSSAHYTRVKS